MLSQAPASSSVSGRVGAGTLLAYWERELRLGDGIGMEAVETQLPSSMQSPQLARAFLRAALETWKLDGFGDVTELLATELVANVVTHVGGSMTLRVQRGPSTMRVEIEDSSAQVPVVRHPDTADEHGRGVLLVDELANAWGVEPRGDGKTVWFEIDVSTATAEAHDGAAS